MASSLYPAVNEVTQHDVDELRQKAQKALALRSPHAQVSVPVDAEKLLTLLEMAEPSVRQ